MRPFHSGLLLLLFPAVLLGQNGSKMEPGPKVPGDSLKCIKLRPGFTIELMAAEPLVRDPIAFAWGPDGKFWVVEMGDYPLGVDGKGKFGGRVKFLEKTKGDGAYDKATVFLDRLGYPTGVFPWGKGVLITCAPDVLYAEDTDGDGRADKKVAILTGFAEGNQQHRVNGLVWGLDNWIYGANGDSGGLVKVVHTVAPDGTVRKFEGKPVNISGRDFRFKPDTGEFEAVTGMTQFGRCRDDWGNWFGCNNSNPCFHFVLDDHYLRRNPHVLYPPAKVAVPEKPGAAVVYPISKPLARFNDPHALNHFTSACSIHIYRDDLFGPEFANNTFVCEPVHNLIHREILTPKGVAFTSKRAADEQQSEFLASTDSWFRPVMVQTGPDGALWVADMYRYVIEHPQWIPKDWQKKLDLRAGHDLGRIYRIYPEGKKPRAIVNLQNKKTEDLVANFDSSSGWQRDTAQCLLTQRQIGIKDKTTWHLLDAMLKSPRPHTRLHALCTLDALAAKSWGKDALVVMFPKQLDSDGHPAVRKQIIRVQEPFLNVRRGASAVIGDELESFVGDPDPQVRLQLAHSLGQWDAAKAGKLLARLSLERKDDRYLVAAIMSSVNKANWDALLDELFRRGKGQALSGPLAENLLRLAQGFGSTRGTASLFASVARTKQQRADRFATLLALLDVLDQKGISMMALWKEGDPVLRNALEELESIFGEARMSALNMKAGVAERRAAVRLLGRGLKGREDDLKALSSLLGPRQSDEVQLAAATSLAQLNDKRVPDFLLKPWKTYLPALRSQVLDGLLARPDGVAATLAALEKKQIQPLEIDAARRQRLLDHKDKNVRIRAAQLLAGSTNSDRRKVVASYAPTLKMTGDAARGAKVFTRTCAACHKLGGLGQQVGPDLASVRDKTPEGLLTAILDPNAAVEARYLGYTAVTRAGLTVAGLLDNETTTSITLVGIDGKKNTILRADLDELFSSGKSAMPEGLEKDIAPADMADLIAFVRGSLPAAKPKVFEGNRPELVKADGDGVLYLTASICSIYGKTLVLEKQYSNLGYWSSPDDRAVWAMDVPKGGKYAVFLNYACAKEAAGNSFVLQAGDAKLAGKIESTGTWDAYRNQRVGEIELQAGVQEIELRALGTIKGALLDLKGIKLLQEKKATEKR